MFANVIDSSKVRVQRGGSSRSAARCSCRSTQDPAEVEQLREELRLLEATSCKHEYYATQIQQQQTLIQVSSKDNSFHFKICIDLKC